MRSDHPKLPRDLTAFSTRIFFKRLIPFCVVETLLVVMILTLGDKLFQTDLVPVVRGLIYAILLVIPALMTRFPWKLVDHTYWGLVESVKGKHIMHGAGRFGNWYSAVLCVTVRTSKGKLVRQKLPMPASQEEIPAPGERVFHLWGSDHLILLPTPSDDHVHCAACNEINPPDAPHCRTCGRSLIIQ